MFVSWVPSMGSEPCGTWWNAGEHAVAEAVGIPPTSSLSTPEVTRSLHGPWLSTLSSCLSCLKALSGRRSTSVFGWNRLPTAATTLSCLDADNCCIKLLLTPLGAAAANERERKWRRNGPASCPLGGTALTCSAHTLRKSQKRSSPRCPQKQPTHYPPFVGFPPPLSHFPLLHHVVPGVMASTQHPLKSTLGASLVVQWLRICLLMQGTRVRTPVWENPTCHRATKPVSHNY